MTRTDAEIVARIEQLANDDGDWLGFSRGDLIARLPLKLAAKFLRPDAECLSKPEDWAVFPRDRESVLAEMRGYMPFAWEKANNCRGISAGRSMDHYSAWIWLLGDEDFALFSNLGDYEYYGKDNLVRICKHYGWDDLLALDDGRRVNSESE